MSAATAAISSGSFKWALRELVAQEAASSAARNGAKPTRPFPLRVIDTVFFRHTPQGGVEVDCWVYCNKSGLVVERRAEDLTWNKIQERFCRFALANPENRQRTVACLSMTDGTSTQLDDTGLKHLATVAGGSHPPKDLLGRAAHLQCYVRPCHGSPAVCRVTYCVDRNGATSLDVSLLGGLRAVEEDGARQEVEMAAYEVIRYLEASGGVLNRLVLDFTVDDNGDPWLHSLSTLSYQVKPPPKDVRHPTPLPPSGASSDDPSPAAAARRSVQSLGMLASPLPSSPFIGLEEGLDVATPPLKPPQPPHKQTLNAPAGVAPPGASSPAKIAAARTPTATHASGDVRSNGPHGSAGGGNPLPSRTPPVLNGHKPASTAQQRALSQVTSVYGGEGKAAPPASAAVVEGRSRAERAMAEAEAVLDSALRAQVAVRQQEKEQEQEREKERGGKGKGRAGEKGGARKGKVEEGPEVEEESDLAPHLKKAAARDGRPMPEFHAPLNTGDAELANVIKENRRFNEVMIGLRERNATLEEEIRSVREAASRSEEARSTAETDARDAQRRLATAKQAFARTLQDKEEAAQRELLEAEGRHNKELAAKAAQIAALRSEEARGEVSDAHKGANSLMANKGLVQKLEEVEEEFSNAKAHWAREKRTLMSAHAQEIQELHLLNREQGSSNNGYIAKLEDTIEDLKAQIEDAKKLVDVVEGREREANARRHAAESAQERLAGEKRQLQDHLQAAQCFEVRQDNGVTVDGEKALAALAATSEARVRQANNKVEYLKAQLSSEQTLKAELEATVTGMKEKLLKQKSESKRQLALAEESKKAALRDTEERLRQDMETYISEVAHLQAKVMTLQGQLGDALQDVGLAKRREESQKGETSKAVLEVSAMQLEIDSLKKQLDDLAKANALDEDYRAKLATSEAMLRRLDNERLYLKSQLSSELTCKNELQATLDQAHCEYSEARNAWKKEREELDEAARQADIRREVAESELKRHKSQTELEVAALSHQNADLKASYAKTRDQLRIEQSALERLQGANRRLQDELLAQHEELKNARAESDGAARRQTENLELVKASMEQIEAEKAGEIARLQTELHSHLQRLANLQEELVSHRRLEAEAHRRANKLLAAQKIFHAVEKWRNVRRLWVMHSWRRGSLVKSLEDQVNKKLSQTISDSEARARCELEDEMSSLTAKLRAERQQAVEKVTAAAEEEMERLKQEWEGEKQQALGELRQQCTEELETRCMENEEVLTRLGFQYRDTIARMKFEEEEKMLRTHLMHEGALSGVKSEAERRIEEATRDANEHAEQRWQKYVKDKLSELKRERAHDLDAARDQYSRALDRREQAIAKEKEELQAKAAAERDAAVDRERAVADQRIAEALAAAEVEFDKRRAEAERVHAARMKQLSAEWDEKFRKAEAEAQAREKLSINATVATKRAMEEQRAKAVSLEITKWQKALSEAEQQMEEEKKAAFRRGVEERNAQAQHEAAQLKIAGEIALSEVRESARRSLTMAQAKAAEILEHTRSRLLQEKDEALRELQERVEKDLRHQWDESLRAALDNAEKTLAAAVEEEKRLASVAISRLETRFQEKRVAWQVSEKELDGRLAAAKAETKRVREAMRLALGDADSAFEKAREAWGEAQREALFQQAQELLKEKDAALQDTAKAAATHEHKVLEDFKRKAEGELMDAVARFDTEREGLLKQMAERVAEVRREVTDLQALLTRRQELLDEAVGRQDELSSGLETEKRKATFNLMRMLAAAKRNKEAHEREVANLQQNWEERLHRAESEAAHESTGLQDEISRLQDIIHECEARRLDMYETLVNHKREVLLDHKVQSEVLSREADQLAQQRDTVEHQKKEVQRELKRSEELIKELEHELHEHGKRSAIKHGRIDVAHARKKKRLDEDLESAMESIEARRSDVLALDERLAELLEHRQDKEDEMKILERKLVEVLVEQQKKLLHTLNEEGVMISRGLNSAGPHVTRRTNATMMHSRTLPDVTSPLTTRHRTSNASAASPNANHRPRPSQAMSPNASQGRTAVAGFNNQDQGKVSTSTRTSITDASPNGRTNPRQNGGTRISSVLFKKGGKLSDE